MASHKHIDIICIAAVCLSVVLTILLMAGSILGVLPVLNAEAGSGLFTENDLNGDWDTASATSITLSDTGTIVSGNGAYVYDGDVHIVYGGYYVLSGELTDGSVIVEADKSDNIWIALDGAAIHCDDGAAIRVEQANRVFLTLAEGTENTLSSGEQYSAETAVSGVDGTIYSRDDLTINGTGSLAVSAVYQHGIVCNDNLAITGGHITINAVQDGIHAHDSVRIRDAALSITAGDDGITVSNDDETAFLYVESGEISIPACYEGLEAIDITIAGGTIDIRPTDDGINANGSGAGSVIRITGGDITIINPTGRDADGLDSNGSICIEGGTVFISVTDSGGNSAIDYGSENGGECIVSGGSVIACGGSAMAEGFHEESPQGFLMYSTSAAADTRVSLKDALGAELLSWEVPCSFSSVVISAPDMKVGDVCTIEIGDVQEQVTIDNVSASGFRPAGMFGGGMKGGRGYDPGADGQGDSDSQSFGGRNERPGEMPDGMPGDLPEDMPGGMPGDLPEDMPGDMPGDLPEDMPGDMPSDLPEDMPGGMPSDLPDDMPGDMPQAGGNGFSNGQGRRPFSEDSDTSGDAERSNGTDPSDGTDAANGMKPSKGADATNGAEPFNGADAANGTEPSGSADATNGAEPFNGADAANGTEPSGSADAPSGTEPSDSAHAANGAEPSDDTDATNGGSQWNRQERGTDGERAPGTDAEQTQRGGGHFPQQNGNQPYSGNDMSSESSSDTFALIGISMLTMLIGLAIVSKLFY